MIQAHVQWNIGLLKFKDKKFKEAITIFTEIQNNFKENISYWYRLGLCYYNELIKSCDKLS